MQKSTKNIVCLGAGTGQASVLKGLSIMPVNLYGIVGITDNGGSSGAIRRSMDIPAPGDTRNCLISVSDPDEIMTKLFEYRFVEGDLQGTNLGNLIIAALARVFGDFGQAITMANIMLKTKAQIFPASVHPTHICAELMNNRKIKGEWEIITRKDKSKIKQMFLKDKISAYPPCISSILKADLIVIGPGALFTALCSILLISGIANAICTSKAKICYVANLMTQPGQTDKFALSDHVKIIEKYLGKKLDYILINNKKISGQILNHYNELNSNPVQLDKIKNDKRLIKAPLAQNKIGEAVRKDLRKGKAFKEWSLWTHILRHDSKRVAEEILKLL